MKVKVDTIITNRKNEPIKGAESDLTLGEVMENSLLFDNPGNPHDGTERYRRYKLQNKVEEAVKSESKELETSVEEMALIKKCIGASTYTTLVVGRCYDLIEASKETKQ